jgi:predicted glycogen debranching enzyme
VRGTHFNIGVDPVDDLIHAGAQGYQLTWMDAKVGDWVVTPRRGKPVEIQALWHNALRLMAGWAPECGDAAAPYAERAAFIVIMERAQMQKVIGIHLIKHQILLQI